MPKFYEFFAGGGMARAGLGADWQCLYANDFDPMKVDTYRANWGKGDMHLADINIVTPSDLPSQPDLAWASFPCQDLSLAGNYAGIGMAGDKLQTRSGTFWAFWKLMMSLRDLGRAPPLIVLENVSGVLTSNGGKDFAAIGDCFAHAGYRFGAVLMDAVRFVPQSRPRVFIIGVRQDQLLPAGIQTFHPSPVWHPKALLAAYDGLERLAKEAWIWWHLPLPTERRLSLEQILESDPSSVEWHTPSETKRLVSMMSDLHLSKLHKLQAKGVRKVATIYRRTRAGIQRAELRTDGIAGCLRTPAGGSSRQLVMVINGEDLRSRLLSAREAAKLMGLPARYKLPRNYNDAYHVAGDGVAVPVVRHLRRFLLQPLIDEQISLKLVAAE